MEPQNSDGRGGGQGEVENGGRQDFFLKIKNDGDIFSSWNHNKRNDNNKSLYLFTRNPQTPHSNHARGCLTQTTTTTTTSQQQQQQQ